jgi:hypothetical protein
VLRNRSATPSGPPSLEDFCVETGHTIRLVARTPANSPYNSPQGPHTLQADAETMAALAAQHQRLLDSLASAGGGLDLGASASASAAALAPAAAGSPELAARTAAAAAAPLPSPQRPRGTSMGSEATMVAAVASAARRRVEQRRVNDME